MQDLSLVEQSATVLNIDEVMMVAAEEEEVGRGGFVEDVDGDAGMGVDDGGIGVIGVQHPVIEENFGIVRPETVIVPA